MTEDAFGPARSVILRGLSDHAFPAASVSVGNHAAPRWQESFGRLTYDDSAPPCRDTTLFDLASLTKVIATSSITMRQLAEGRIRLDIRVTDVFKDWSGHWPTVTLRHLLEHASGLPAHLRAWKDASGRAGYKALIEQTSLERQPGEAAVYSDIGFMLLGLILESTGAGTLDKQFQQIFGRAIDPIQYRPMAHLYERIAPTEFDPWRGRVLCGEVHDENAAALGGVAAHAGLFGTADAVGTFARLILRTFRESTLLGSPDAMRLFATRSAVPASSRALAWDTALPTSSCGTRMSPGAIGHTGFTGTSLWIDPAADFYAVLLTNRVHPTRTNEKLIPLRAQFHDALPR